MSQEPKRRHSIGRKGKMSVSSSSLASINTFLNALITFSSQKKVIRNLVMEGIIVNTKTGQYVLSIGGTIL